MYSLSQNANHLVCTMTQYVIPACVEHLYGQCDMGTFQHLCVEQLRLLFSGGGHLTLPLGATQTDLLDL